MNDKITNMLSVETSFRDAYEHTVSNVLDPKRLDEIKLFLAGITTQTSIYMAFTTVGLPELMQNVFRTVGVREFVFNLSMAFNVRLGLTHVERSQLVDILTNAVSILPPNQANADPSVIAIPKVVLDNLPSYEDIRELLNANNWLMTIVMVCLYLRVENNQPSKR